MRNIVQYIMSFLMLFITMNAQSKESAYTYLVSLLREGQMPTVSVELEKCSYQGDKIPSTMMGFARPQEYLIDTDQQIAYFSINHLSYREGKAPTQEYLKYKLYDGDFIKLSIFSFTLPNYHPKKISEYTCQFGMGFKFNPES